MATDRQFRDGVSLAITALRAERRWTQRELCRRTDLSPAYLSELESAQKDASADVLDRLATAFGIGMDEFLWTALLGMMVGEIPSPQRRDSALDVARHMLNVDPESLNQVTEFIEFQKWRAEGKPALRSRRITPFEPTEAEKTDVDFTEE